MKLRRLELGMPLHEVAALCGRSKSFISNVEHGFIPKPARMAQIAAALHTTPEALWPAEHT